jgi:sterol desaturase/sphingolipid hydroxylase (fatty acid hydroxylase superfamily)
MEKMIVTPRMHRCHHSLHPHCFNTNFSTILSFWDRLFGSYHWARSSHELEKVGLYKISGPETMKIVPFLKTPLLK